MKKLAEVWQRVRDSLEDNPKLYIIALIAIAIVTHIQWFNPLSVLEFGDWQYRPDEQVQQMLTAWNSWVPFNNFGEVNILMSGFPFRGLAWGIITSLGFTYDIATKLTLFIPVALGGFLAPYFLGRRLFKNNLIAFTLALFYGSTTYFLIIQTAHLPIGIIYMLLPLLLLFLDKAMDENRMRDWLVLTLIFCVGIFYEVRMMYLIGLLLTAYFFVFAFTRGVNIKHYLRPIGVSLGTIVLINIFWLLPTKIAAVSSIGDVASRGLFGDSLFNILQSLTLMKWNWTGTLIDRTFTAQPIPVHLWIIPLVVAVGIIFAEHYRKRMLFFLVITVLGLLLSKQSAEPFPFLYHWLYNNFPGFVLFREASKFYVLVAFGYFGLLGYGLVALRQRDFKIGHWKRAYGYYASIVLILLVAGLNLKPAFTTELGGTFKQAQMPDDYKKLKKFITDQPEYFRTYWVPRESWWGYYDNLHPKVRSVDVLQKEWEPMLSSMGSGHGYDLAKGNVEIFQQPYSAQLFKSGAVKYVIVPIRDKANDDDFFGSYGDDRQYYISALDKIPFLKKINIGTSGVVVYENTQFRPYISATTEVFDMPATVKLPTELPLFFDQFATDFRVLEKKQTHQDGWAGTGLYQPLFTAESTFTPGSVVQKTTVSESSDLVADGRGRQLSYKLNGSSLAILERPAGNIKVNNQVLTGKTASSAPLLQTTLLPKNEYFVGLDTMLIPVDKKVPERTLGWVSSGVKVYQASAQNRIPNSDFEKQLWEPAVRDCNNYDGDPRLGMRHTNDGRKDGNYYLQLAATRHTACTGQRNIPVTAGAHLFSFEYQNEGGQKAGYKLTFNDDKKTTIEADLPIGDEAWHRVTRTVMVPDATTVAIEVYGYPDQDHYMNSLTRYDHFRLSPLQQIAAVPALPSTALQKVPLTPGSATFSYENSSYSFANLIPNASLEEGLWQKKVGDCNNMDSNPDIGMSHSKTALDGKHSLQLEAAAHIACTGPPAIAVKENTTYQLQFAYQSATADNASYYIAFNDPANTTIQEGLPLKNTKWQAVRKEMSVPWGATKMTLVVYATPNTYSTQKVSVRYDAFSLVEMPGALSHYYVVKEPVKKIVAPQDVSFSIVGPTKKRVYVKGATTPFYLTMSESYHDGWRMVLADQAAKGPLASWWPLARPHTIASSAHVKLNGFVNSWYVDPEAFCKGSTACRHNSDGSYDIEAFIEFAPQRWFVAGSIVSGLTVMVAVGYLVYQRRRTRGDA